MSRDGLDTAIKTGQLTHAGVYILAAVRGDSENKYPRLQWKLYIGKSYTSVKAIHR